MMKSKKPKAPGFDLAKAATLCARAFFDDPLDGYYFPDERNRTSRQTLIYTYFLKKNLSNVNVTSPALEGLAVWEKPYTHVGDFNPRDLLMSLPLFKAGFAAIRKMVQFQSAVVRLQMQLIQDPFWYLKLVAIAPEFQGQGFAGRLLRPSLAAAEERGEPVFLETHNPRNIPIYEKYGFRVVLKQEIGKSGIQHYCLRKK